MKKINKFPISPAYYFDGKMFHWEEGDGTRWSVMQQPDSPRRKPLETARAVILDFGKHGIDVK